MEIKQLIGMRIKHLRRAKGMSQEYLAEKSGISFKYVSSIERGKENPTLDTFIKMSLALDVEISELFNYTSSKTRVELKRVIADLIKSDDDEKLKLTARIVKDIYL